MSEMKDYVEKSLREIVLGDVLAEAKSVDDWWDKLPGKRRSRVVSILGMSKGKDKSLFSKLEPDEQEEISAYYRKYKGKVEGINIEPGVILSEMSDPSAPYKSLNDAAKVTGNPVYKKGRTEIWFMTKEGWHKYSVGRSRDGVDPSVKDPGNLGTHKLLGSISATDKEQIFMAMQGEMWSPQAQARNLILGKGLVHTSMSVGDVIKIGNRAWMVDMRGFRELGKGKTEGREFHGDELSEAGGLSHPQLTPDVVKAARTYLQSRSKSLASISLGLAKHVRKETGKPLGMPAVAMLLGQFMSMEGL